MFGFTNKYIKLPSWSINVRILGFKSQNPLNSLIIIRKHFSIIKHGHNLQKIQVINHLYETTPGNKYRSFASNAMK